MNPQLDNEVAPSTREVAHLLYTSAVELARRIAAGELRAVEVVEAHIHRIEQVNPAINAICWPRFDEARREAETVDLRRARGEALEPLAGVPITVKECFHLPGTPSSIGIGRLADEPLSDESINVARLRAAGAIVVGKTNVPQLMIMHETDNPVYGRTDNPWDTSRGPGGSSGGEGAIIAAGGVPLGLGNDLGGSVRHPAHVCGICGLKPTTGRLSNQGARGTWNGMEAVGNQPGPLAQCVADVALAMRVLADPGQHGHDPYVPDVRWRDPDQVDVASLRIGYFTDDGFFPPSPALRRAVREAASALEQQGATVVELPPPDMRRAMRLYFALVSADGGADARRLLGRSKRDWRVRKLLWLGMIPKWLRPAVAQGLDWTWQPRMGELIRSAGYASADRYWQLTKQRERFTVDFCAQLRAKNIDALLCPPHALPALTHGSTQYLAAAASYAMLFNLVGMPAGVVPVTRVQAGEEGDRPASWDAIDYAARKVEADSAGLPVGVQIAAHHWREDVVLRLMQALEDRLRGGEDYSLRPPL